MDSLKIAINSRTSGKFRIEQINGRSHLVTGMIPIVGNTAMNRIMYPEAEVSNSYAQLNMLPAPAGHPEVNGTPVSAFHPLAVNAHNIGGFTRSPRRNGLKVECDFCIDIEVANAKEDGKEVVRRVKAGEAVGVSTGLTISHVRNETGTDQFGGEFDHIGSGFKFDHVAILLDEAAAGAHAGTALVTNAEGMAETVFIADVKPQGTEEPADTGMGISTDQLHDLLTQMIRAEAAAQHAECDDFFAWVQDTFPDSKIFIYSVEIDGVRRLFKRSYTIDAAGKVSLGADAVPVSKQTRFVPEGRLNNQQKDSDMDKLQFVLALIGNSATTFTMADKDRLLAMSETDLALEAAPVLNSEKAKDHLKADGFDFEKYEEFVANKDAFKEFQTAAGDRMGEMRTEIVNNSEYTEADLEGMTEPQLVKLNTAVGPKDVDRLAPGATAITHNSAAQGDAGVVDYS